MTDEEYREFLSALARKHVRARMWRRHLGPDGGDHLRYEIDRLASTARFVKAATERVGQQELLDVVAKELSHTYLSNVTQAMDESGVLEALEEAPDITFRELRRSAIPDEDVELLRLSGVDEPEATITIIIHYTRKHVGTSDTRPSTIARRAQEELHQAANMLASETENVTSQPTEGKKKRKVLNGVGKILSGAILGAGNLLLATGTIAAPNPATGYAVIGSSALAIGSICQGMGDLRGE